MVAIASGSQVFTRVVMGMLNDSVFGTSGIDIIMTLGVVVAGVPWGPGEVSCIQWNPFIVDTVRMWCSVLYGKVSSFQEPLYCGHLGDLMKCPI